MTPEEQFQRIDNALAHIAEIVADSEERHAKWVAGFEERQKGFEERQKAFEARMDAFDERAERTQRHLEVLVEMMDGLIRDREIQQIKRRLSALEEKQ